MLLFKPQHVAPILEGRKTQTRRLWNRPRVKVGSIHQARLKMLDKRSTFAYLRIKRIWKAGALDQITQEETLAEGYPSVQHYLNAFRAINRWEPDQVGVTGKDLWAIEFEVVPQGGGVTG